MNKNNLPLIPLRGITILPHMIIHFDVGREKSIKALEAAMEKDQIIFLASQKDILEEKPDSENIHEIGTITKVKQILRLPGKTIRVLVEGIKRGRIVEYTQLSPFLKVEIEEIEQVEEIDEHVKEALKRKAIESFEAYVELTGRITPETVFSIISTENFDKFVDVVIGAITIKMELKQMLLEEFNPVERINKLLPILQEEMQILELEKDISKKVKVQIDDMQKQYYLKEQLKVIQGELGENAGIDEEITEYEEAIKTRAFSDEVKKKLDKEIKRLKKTNPMSAESGVIRTYIESLLEMPWGIETDESLDVFKAEKILERDHYGLEKVKERIIEYIATKKMSKGLNAPIICLVGPPGVGKTSIVKSIAEAVNREYVRMSLGGVRDEAEIRGHRKTYIGAMPGRIAKSISKAGSMNPLILFDEIDKLGSDFRGDPASAMLEVLDAEQNNSFRDHYLEVALDLSKVMFITTANTIDTIPRPLLDRMEIIEVSGYTGEEKLKIANNYLLPKQLKLHGLTKTMFKYKDDAILDTINSYTRESGVRNLERKIALACRKVATLLIKNNKKSFTINMKNMEEIFGPRRFSYEKAFEEDDIGIVRGLAWTSVGGDTLSIEVNVMDGSGEFQLTGQLGDVMQESAKAALSFIRSKQHELGITEDFSKTKDIHIHIPEGGVPKDGPSAGVTMAIAIISALSGVAIRKDVAMTGEITLRGRVLPIGGLKEKLTAARRAGMKTIFIPYENKKDIKEIPKSVTEDLEIICVRKVEEILSKALKK